MIDIEKAGISDCSHWRDRWKTAADKLYAVTEIHITFTSKGAGVEYFTDYKKDSQGKLVTNDEMRSLLWALFNNKAKMAQGRIDKIMEDANE